jgi:nitrite reductase/ring-hydroxylating ferredoxin subunit/uncharacterized membrane protein
LDLASFLVEDGNALVRGAYYAMLLGVVMALVAAVPGFVDRADIRLDDPAKKTATTHMVLNLVAVVIFIIDLWLRSGRLDAAEPPILPVLLSLLGLAILAYSGYLGGTLVYDDGIAVGRHRRRTSTPVETVVAVPGGKDGFVAVTAADSLPDGETLRAEVNGVVMTIARADGKLFAFQEFCTHRFGPLSEGAIIGCEIECPWHRSRFDMRSGKVTQGPAKVDLRAFEVIERDGKILVRAEEQPAREADAG